MDSSLGRETRLADAAASESSGEDASSSVRQSQLESATGEYFDDNDEGALTPEVRALIERCMNGTEPLGRDLRPFEPQKFSTQHINMVLLKVAGFRHFEIAQSLGYEAVRVTHILQHPYARKILHAVIAARGGRVLDIRTKLESYADEILDQIFELTAKSNDLEQVTKVGFGLLDRAGYNTTQKVQHVPAANGLASEGALSRLANALDQSMAVDTHIMPAYVPKPPPEDQSRGEVGAHGAGRDDNAAPIVSGSGSSGLRLAKVSNE